MNQAWIEPVVLEGRFVRLEPLDLRHAEALACAASVDTFTYFVGIQPAGPSPSDFREYVREMCEGPQVVPFAIIACDIEVPVGCTSYMDIRSEHRALEIGMTWIGKPWQGGRTNPEAKLLLLRHAFRDLGAERVQLKTDARNLQSQRAIAKLRAHREGVLRSYSIAPDGIVTDRIMYSIVKSEWPKVEKGLVERL